MFSVDLSQRLHGIFGLVIKHEGITYSNQGVNSLPCSVEGSYIAFENDYNINSGTRESYCRALSSLECLEPGENASSVLDSDDDWREELNMQLTDIVRERIEMLEFEGEACDPDYSECCVDLDLLGESCEGFIHIIITYKKKETKAVLLYENI